MKCWKKQKPHDDSGCKGRYVGFGRCDIFAAIWAFWIIGFIAGGNDDHCHTFLAIPVPSCLLRVVVRSNGSYS